MALPEVLFALQGALMTELGCVETTVTEDNRYQPGAILAPTRVLLGNAGNGDAGLRSMNYRGDGVQKVSEKRRPNGDQPPPPRIE